MKTEIKIINYAEGGTKKIVYHYDTSKWTWADSRWTKKMVTDALRHMADEIEGGSR